MQTCQANLRITDLQLVTFRCGELLLGLNIEEVQEINRHIRVTTVPDSPDYVRGAINLRGDLATVIDLRAILGLGSATPTSKSRNVMVQHHGENVGLLVDSVGDILRVPRHAIEAPPANLHGTDGRLFEGVFDTPQGIVLVLKREEVFQDDDMDSSDLR